MASPYASGGGGTHLEAKVAGSFLAATLCEASVRGLPGDFAIQLQTQRAKFGDPLDDIVADGAREDGRRTRLHLQVTNTLSFTANDDKWVDILKRAWDTFSNNDFDRSLHRIGAGIGTYSARADQHYQSVLSWAEHSTDAGHFFERIAQGDYSHADKQSFVAGIDQILASHAGRPIEREELWRFLKCFVIVHYDFRSAAASRDEANIVERLKGLLPPERRGEASSIWDHLVAKAGELIPVGGGATRATLIEQLNKDSIAIGVAPSFRNDIAVLERESRRALGDIKSEIQGLTLHRAGAYEQVREALADARFVQIDGEPGTGKSALLKEIAEESARNGPIFVLKDGRIQPNGWVGHAHVLGISGDMSALLHEFSCAGEPILFIDGIDKIVDPAVQLTVNDIVRAIADGDTLAAWRVLVTVREQNLKHLETWLDPDALKKLRIRTVAVATLKNEELSVVAGHFPRLRPLLSQSEPADFILRRPFFLNALLSLTGATGAEAVPATEVELLRLWWQLGGADRKDSASAQHRRNALMQAADAVTQAPNAPVAIQEIAPEALEELKAAGVLRDKELGHSIVFAHDIYEEWSLCEYLIGRQEELAYVLRGTGEPDALIRPMQLLGSYVLETNASPDAWTALLNATAAGSFRPVWQRAVLTSSVQSTRTVQLLEKLASYLLEENGSELRKLLRAMRTVEVLPNPLFLNEQLTPDLEPSDRATYANLTAIPKPLTWVRFFDWLIPRIDSLPQSLIPDLIPLFKTWQDTYAGRNVRHCKRIGEISYEWLKEIEAAVHPRSFKDYRQPFGGRALAEDSEKLLRGLFLESAGELPDLVTEYLQQKAADQKHTHLYLHDILQNCRAVALHLPGVLVDFLLAALLEQPDDDRDPFGSYSDSVFENFGIADHHEFYPASPVQPPFLILLRTHLDEGLRLIRGLCNHSIGMWRQARSRGRRYRQAVTPVPLTLTFAWGTQTFWGDGQVYLWFRGMLANDATESGLMALEQWALEQLGSGADFDAIFQEVIEGNESVAALGLGVSLCLAHPKKSLQAAFPLVTCAYLWEWDIARSVQEGSPSNEIGNWHTNKVQMTAVRALNQRPHRRRVVRDLVPYFVFSADQSLREGFAESVRAFPEQLPISYEEEKSNADHLAALREKMVLFAGQADPQYWKAAPTGDGEHIQIWNEPPELEDPKFKAEQERHALLNAHLSVALWANDCRRSCSLDSTCSVRDAVAKVRGWDKPDLFDIRSDSFEERQQAAAVVSTAYVAAKYAVGDEWTPELASWCMNVFERAATGPEAESDLFVRSAALVMHPAVFAAHGYSALLTRGHRAKECQDALLNLAVDPLEGIQIAVLSAAKQYAASLPRFYWVLLGVLIGCCIMEAQDAPDHHSVAWSAREAERMDALLRQAEVQLGDAKVPALPAIPLPWIKSPKTSARARKGTKGYTRSPVGFLWNLGAKIVDEIHLEPLLADPTGRAKFLAFVGNLLDYTSQEIVPPFAKSKRDYDGHAPFEWVSAFSSLCGRLCAYLTGDEAKQLLLSKIWAEDAESSFLILDNLMRSYMIRGLLTAATISDDRVALWGEMIDWLLKSDEWTRSAQRNHLDREFLSCALSSLFCAGSGFTPMVCGIDRGWPHLGKFLPVLEHAIRAFGTSEHLYFGVVTLLKGGGFDLLPDPALDWINELVVAQKGDRKFWDTNGESTIGLLNELISKKRGALTDDHRKMIGMIADVLIDEGVRGAGFLQQKLLRRS
jgi:hypothetical protein